MRRSWIAWVIALGSVSGCSTTKQDDAPTTSAAAEESSDDASSSDDATTGSECAEADDVCFDLECCEGLHCYNGTCIDDGGDGDGDGDDDDCVFANCFDMDGGGVCRSADGTDERCQCDIWNAKNDCPEGEKCTAWADMGSSWNRNSCKMVMGDDQPGDDCIATDGSGISGNDTCVKGSMCWDIDADTQTGYCIEFCEGDANNPNCPGETSCAIANDGVLPICLHTCDPLNGGADCPNTKNVCIANPNGEDFVCVLDASGGMGTAGTDCMYANSCNQGLVCIDAAFYPGCGATGCCTEFCDLNDDPNGDTCTCKPQGCTCISWWDPPEDAPPGYMHVGFCGIPE